MGKRIYTLRINSSSEEVGVKTTKINIFIIIKYCLPTLH